MRPAGRDSTCLAQTFIPKSIFATYDGKQVAIRPDRPLPLSMSGRKLEFSDFPDYEQVAMLPDRPLLVSMSGRKVEYSAFPYAEPFNAGAAPARSTYTPGPN